MAPYTLISNLPDPFLLANGKRVATETEWQERRREIRSLIQTHLYGTLPPKPDHMEPVLLLKHKTRHLYEAIHTQHRITLFAEGSSTPFSFILDLLSPECSSPLPVILHGDGCWNYCSDDVVKEVLDRGYILARFNRLEFAPDVPVTERSTGLYAFQEGNFGAIAAWAYGYSRCVDFLETFDGADAGKIAITGHSRGGKTVLLAGAMDERIALTAPNNSGNNGCGCYRFQGPKCERIENSVGNHGFWYTPKFEQYVNREADIPFDLHELKALVAPRALLTTEAMGDRWANPSGSWQTFAAAREVYRFLGAEEKIATHYREGLHYHSFDDWNTFLNFADWQLKGSAPEQTLNVCPFSDLPKVYDWTVPKMRLDMHS